MRVIARSTLISFIKRHPDAEQAVLAWFAHARRVSWSSPHDVKKQYARASILRNGRVVFNICGNAYRLVVAVNYSVGIVFIRFIGTHREYDNIDAESI